MPTDLSDKEKRTSRLRKAPAGRLISPTRVTLVENEAAFDDLVSRIDEECRPRDVQQQGDALTMAQLRWRVERLEGIQNTRLNWVLLHNAVPQDARTNEERLMFAYYACLGDPLFQFAEKQFLAHVKTLHSLSARIERWSNSRKETK